MSINRREALKRIATTGALFAMGPLTNLFADENTKIDKKYFKYELNKRYPKFNYFSVDSLGTSKLSNNPILSDEGIVQEFIVTTKDKITNYFVSENDKKPLWQFIETNKGFILKSFYFKGKNTPWDIKFNQHKNHATVLGIVPVKNKILTPCVLHLPEMGSMKIRSKQVESLDYTAERINVPTKYVKISFPSADAYNREIEYSFEIDAIYPELKNIVDDKRFNAYRRSYLNALQVNPNVEMLANNSTSDSCAFVQYGYSEIALMAPNLVDDFKAIDMVKMTIENYLQGHKGYGMKGYISDAIEGSDKVNWGNQKSSLDTYPSLLISACNYYEGSKNTLWINQNFEGIKEWAEEIISRDSDGDGILEYGFSGNSGSWDGTGMMRPSNWWDTIGFAHKDAYSNALAYRALIKFSKICKTLKNKSDAKKYNKFAEKLKSNYYDTFINPESGVLAGWKSADGELHDYYFVFVNAIAVAYDLLDEKQGNYVMDNLLAKMEDVGFDNFELGLPGNLINIPKEDYTHHNPRWGGNTMENSTAGWQHYENGGTSGNYVYFTIRALFKLNRKKDAEKILFPLLRGIEAGNFQGDCENGKTKDWRAWDGECWGYEGFLVDNYWSMLTVAEEYK